MKTTLKFTGPGRAPLYGRTDYPPVGEWSEDHTPILCRSGWHVHTDDRLSLTLGAEMWVVEVDGHSVSNGEKESYQRIRFVRQVMEWSPAAFAARCADRCAARYAADAANAAAYAAAATNAAARHAAAAAARYAADADAERAVQAEDLRKVARL